MGSTALVIEDDVSAADSAVRVLREMGIAAEIAPTVDAGLVALAGGSPDIVLLDLVLDRDTTSLHEALTRRRVPVLLVSGHVPERDTLPSIARPRGWSWLAKPWEPEALREAVGRVMGRATGEHPAGDVQSTLVRSPDGRVTATKGTAQIVSETVVDLGALAIIGTELIYVRPSSEWVQLLCVVGLLLLAGVRIADLLAVARGMPSRGGPAALALAGLGPVATWLARLLATDT